MRFWRRAPARIASCGYFGETGDLKKVVDYIIEETEVGVEEKEDQVSNGKVG